MYNEPNEESINNNETLGHLKNAVWSGDNPFLLCKSDVTHTATPFEDASHDMFMTLASMCYSPDMLKNSTRVSSSTGTLPNIRNTLNKKSTSHSGLRIAANSVE